MESNSFFVLFEVFAYEREGVLVFSILVHWVQPSSESTSTTLSVAANSMQALGVGILTVELLVYEEC